MFIVLPYIYFYLNLLEMDEVITQAAIAMIFIIFLFIAKAILSMDSVEYSLLVSTVFALIFLIPSLIYGDDFRDYLTEKADYFDPPIIFSDVFDKKLTKKIHSPYNHYTLLLPDDWIEYKEKRTGLTYFKPKNSSHKVINLRARCSKRQDKNITETVNDMQNAYAAKNETIEHQCFQWRTNNYACKFKYTNNEGFIKKIIWLATNNKNHHKLSLNAEIQTKDSVDLTLIDSIFNSIEYTQKKEQTGECNNFIE